MNKKEFNKYCAEVMGYKVEEFSDLGTGNPLTGQDETYLVFGRSIYDPYDDLNQMAEVFDKLMESADFIMFKFMTYDLSLIHI